jgi:alginate O-acetyltransferase complex protein AlgI
MLFSSITFLFYFLPVFLLVYFAVPFRLKNAILLAFSLFFYAWGGVKYAAVMLILIALGYFFGLFIEGSRGRRTGKLLLGAGIAVTVSFMLYFKYTDFLLDNLGRLFGAEFPLPGIVLPIGISFYTFQIISYLVDVYRGEDAQRNPINLAAYVAMFPQLIAGPIVRYRDVAQELCHREHSFAEAGEGVRRFDVGIGKKVLTANGMYELSELMLAANEKTVLSCWLYAVSVALYIYFDFSGYSDMAIGLGRILGFHFLENFNYPFISKSATEFWRRWHISLGSWFRDYLYIPLGGNRVPRGRFIFNILAVWLFTGFWHGAAWNFMLWGVFFGILLLIEKFWLGKYLEKAPAAARIYLLLAVLFSFVVFQAPTLGDAFGIIGGMLGFGTHGFASAEAIYYLKSYAVLLLIAAVGSTPLAKSLALRFARHERFGGLANAAEPILILCLLGAVTAFLVDSSTNPFLYFRF